MQNVAKTILQKGRALEVDKKIIPIWEEYLSTIRKKGLSVGAKIFVEAKKPIIIATIPATNCKGTISTWGYLLTIKIRVANVIGITKATIFPDICPLDRVFPSIKINPEIAKIIEAKVIFEIFSFKKKYPCLLYTSDAADE